MLIYVTFLLHGSACSLVQRQCRRAAVSSPDEAEHAGSPSPSPSQACPKPARFGRRSPPPVNVTWIMRLADSLGLATANSCADAVMDSFMTLISRDEVCEVAAMHPNRHGIKAQKEEPRWAEEQAKWEELDALLEPSSPGGAGAGT